MQWIWSLWKHLNTHFRTHCHYDGPVTVCCNDRPSYSPSLSSGISQPAMFADPWIIRQVLSSHLPTRYNDFPIRLGHNNSPWLCIYVSHHQIVVESMAFVFRCRNTFQHQMFVRRRRHVWRPSKVRVGFHSLNWDDALPTNCLKLNRRPAAFDPWSFHPLCICICIYNIYIYYVSGVLQKQTWLWQFSIYMHLWFSSENKLRDWHPVSCLRLQCLSLQLSSGEFSMRSAVLWMRSEGPSSKCDGRERCVHHMAGSWGHPFLRVAYVSVWAW